MCQGTRSKENITTMIQRFEDIQAWQESRKLVKMIYSLTKKELFSKDYGMRDQIQRASVSTMANIAEGFDLHYEQARKAKALIGGFKRSLTNKTFS